MKFLCVRCDEPMKLKKTAGPDEGGSLNVLFHCPLCSQEFALFTNPYETQLVSSLGVKIGGKTLGEASEEKASKCPFSDVVQKAMGGSPPESEDSFNWTPQAIHRLGKIPEFVRPMAKAGIEKFAKSLGFAQVDEEVLEAAKEKFGM